MNIQESFQLLRNELTLFQYSWKSLKSHSILAVAFILALMIIDVFCRELGMRMTKEMIQYTALEMYAPVIGILLFSDLIAQEFEARRADLLRASAAGFTLIVLRKMFHGFIFLLVTCISALLVWRYFYCSVDIMFALGVALPGALYFGTIGLLTAALIRKSIAGYIASFCMLGFSYLENLAAPLEFMTFTFKNKYDNLHFFEVYNWLIAKFFFAGMSLLLVFFILQIIRKPQSGKKVAFCLMAILVPAYGALNAIWEIEDEDKPEYAAPSMILELKQQEDSMIVTTAQSVIEWENNRKKESTSFTCYHYKQVNGQWEKESEMAYPGPTARLKLLDLDVVARIQPEAKIIDATATMNVAINTDQTNVLFVHLPWEFNAAWITVNGDRADFSKYSDLITIKTDASFRQDETVQICVKYNGAFQSFKKMDEIFHDNFFTTNRWHPHLWMNYFEDFSFTATIWLPDDYQVVSKGITGEQDGYKAYRIEIDACTNSYTALIGGKFHRYEDRSQKIPVLVYSFSDDENKAQRILERCRETIAFYESIYSPFPYSYLAVVEDPNQQSGGMAMPTMIKMQSVQWKPEKRKGFMNVYIPHEIAHQWWALPYPKWLCEGMAVMSNYALLDGENNQMAKRELLEDLNRFFRQSQYMGVYPPLQSDRNSFTLYTRAFYFFNTLCNVIGHDQFFKLMAEYNLKTRGGNGYDQDQAGNELIERINRIAEPGLKIFAKEWLETSKTIDPELHSLNIAKFDSGYHVTARLDHKGEIRYPVTVRFVFQDGGFQDEIWDAMEDTNQKSWFFDRPVVSSQIDPELMCLDWDRENNQVKAVDGQASNIEPVMVSHHYQGWTTFAAADGLPSYNVQCMFANQQGKLYVGFADCRESKSTKAYCWYDSATDRLWRLSDDMPRLTAVYSMVEGLQGDLWIYGAKPLKKDGNRLVHIQNGRADEWQLKEYRVFEHGFLGPNGTFDPNPNSNCGISGYHVYCMMPDINNQLWLGTDNGLTCFNPATQECEHYTDENFGLPGTEIFSLMRDSKGILWAGTNKGIASYHENQWIRHPELGYDMVLTMTEDSKGNLWFGTYRMGLYQKTRDQFTHHTPWNSALRHTMITSLAPDESGNVWAGTTEGLTQFTSSGSYAYSTENSGLPSNKIVTLAAGQQDRLWIGTDRGITLYDPNPSKRSVNSIALMGKE